MGRGKTCSTCKKTKPLLEFHKREKSADGRQANCIDCNKKQARRAAWKKAGVVMDEATYQSMLTKQGSRCALCDSRPDKDRQLAVDHDHDTGQVRELLCVSCNTGIGSLGDDPDLLKKAASYTAVRNGARKRSRRARPRVVSPTDRSLLTPSTMAGPPPA